MDFKDEDIIEMFDQIGFKKERYDLLISYFKNHAIIERRNFSFRGDDNTTLPFALKILNDLKSIDNVNLVTNIDEVKDNGISFNFEKLDLFDMSLWGIDVEMMVTSKASEEIIRILDEKLETNIVDIYMLMSEMSFYRKLNKIEIISRYKVND